MTQNKSNNKKKSSSMKVKTPASKSSLNKAKYEIADEFGLNMSTNKKLNENGLSKSKANSRVNSKTRSRKQKTSKSCK